jgi:uncharacterized protein YjcR
MGGPAFTVKKWTARAVIAKWQSRQGWDVCGWPFTRNDECPFEDDEIGERMETSEASRVRLTQVAGATSVLSLSPTSTSPRLA